MNDSGSALQDAKRESELLARSLLDVALVNRDLRCAIRDAITAIERKSYEAARVGLKQALDEVPFHAPTKRKEG